MVVVVIVVVVVMVVVVIVVVVVVVMVVVVIVVVVVMVVVVTVVVMVVVVVVVMVVVVVVMVMVMVVVVVVVVVVMVVVMVMVKVAQYWPEDKPWLTEGITVTPVDINVKMDFVIRSFTMSNGNTTRKITQYQYTAWPDHGVPKIAYGLAQMIKLILLDKDSGGPISVHCSAGTGRTGTVILVLYLLDQLEARGAASPTEALMALRRGRGRLVENTEQYIFAHQVLHEVLFSLKTSFLCHAFEDQLPALRSPQPPDGLSPLHRQHEKLKTLPKDLGFKYGKGPKYAHLNRDQDILPYDRRMVFVQGQGDGVDSQYINVVRINGVDQKDAYLAGEHPQSHTLGRMWRLVYERKVAVWVLVHTFPENHPEFPDVMCGTSALPGNMTLKASPKRSFLNYYQQEVDISVTELGKVIQHQCLLLHLKGWPAAACLPASPEPLLLAMEKVEALSSQHHPPLFTCKYVAVGEGQEALSVCCVKYVAVGEGQEALSVCCVKYVAVGEGQEALECVLCQVCGCGRGAGGS
ncbi:Receptor-type tyrosine-protein phosphatase alpha [Chionoecetes opilio]|uniref:Receptor-type tyrosine-protein phosphatase alpha n=1 Tax=Chionoecetes opilio TaxID=41210 RepID=A0A8J4XPL9_CHIOP|nr:Receptor-type tyrosine-protein phosphatase alpha [Chionoecetes opilio]